MKQKMMQEFIRWAKREHGEDIKTQDISIEEISDSATGKTENEIILYTDEGKTFFTYLREDQFECVGFKEW